MGPITIATIGYAAFTTGGVSAWHYWWTQAFIPNESSPPPQYYALGNFSKFARAGSYRVDVTGAAVLASRARKVPRLEKLTHSLSVYGVAGLTAYHGLFEIGKPKPGETVVVSAAAGAVGSLVGQMARIKGCTAIGIAGSDEKCSLLTRELGFDRAINYKRERLREALRAAAPKGIDVYFDNVGGDILEACLFGMNNFGRIACCGAVSNYDGAPPSHGPRGIPGLVVVKRLTMRGFLFTDYPHEHALAELESWVKAGKLKVHEDILIGLEHLPQALVGLLAGENVGKRMVRVS